MLRFIKLKISTKKKSQKKKKKKAKEKLASGGEDEIKKKSKMLGLEHSYQRCQMPNIWHLTPQTLKNHFHQTLQIP